VDIDRSSRVISVIAVPWDSPASVPFRGQTWQETFVRGAFDGIDSSGTGVRVNRDHDRSRTIGKVIHFDPHDTRGLVAEIQIARTELGDESLALAEEDCLSASVAFMVPAGGEQLDHRTRSSHRPRHARSRRAHRGSCLPSRFGLVGGRLMATLPCHPPPPRWSKSSGNATIGLIRDPLHVDRMAPVLQVTDDRGGVLVIQLSAEEVRDLHADADRLMAADQEQVGDWWKQLADGADGRPRLPAAHLPRTDATAGSAAAAGTTT
jgi:hypothetical protein